MGTLYLLAKESRRMTDLVGLFANDLKPLSAQQPSNRNSRSITQLYQIKDDLHRILRPCLELLKLNSVDDLYKKLSPGSECELKRELSAVVEFKDVLERKETLLDLMDLFGRVVRDVENEWQQVPRLMIQSVLCGTSEIRS